MLKYRGIMSAPLQLFDISRLPDSTDNVAIATRRLEAGVQVVIDGVLRELPYTVLLGHRFAVRPIAPGESLLSWNRPFGVARAAIAPGDYVCNQEMLDALAIRTLEAKLPITPNS